MAVLASKYPTFADLASRMDQDGRIVNVIETLRQTNPILTDMRFAECNKEDGYLTSVRTGLPEPTWRKLYGGVQPSKSQTATVTDTCGNLEAYSEIDKDLADINGNSAAWRASEEEAFLQAMNNAMAETLIYGDTAKTPERFLGLAARYSSLKAKNGRMIINAGGTGSANTSVWFVSWGAGVTGIYPKGSQAGLKAEDLGETTITKTDGSLYQAYRTHFKWSIGLSVRDWRAVSRVANISVEDLKSLSNTAANQALIYKLIDAKNALDPQYRSSAVMYCNRDVTTALEKMALDKSCNALSIVEAAGQFETRFFGIPVRTCDAILNTEKAVA